MAKILAVDFVYANHEMSKLAAYRLTAVSQLLHKKTVN